MSSLTAVVWNENQAAYCPHTDVSGEAWQLVKTGTATSNGASDGTTLVDTNGDSGGADTYSGRYAVLMLSGDNEGQIKRVVDDNGSGTLTFENSGFESQVDSGDEYAIYLTPDPVVVVDSSSGETNMVDAVRADEVDDFWIDYYACPITGTHRGKIAKVTDFVKSTGTFTLESSFGSALSAGDVVLLRRFIETSVQPSLQQPYFPRPGSRVNNAEGDGVVGPKAGSVTFSTWWYPSGSLAASGSKANASVLSGLFQSCGYVEQTDTSSTVSTGSTTSAVKIATGSWENHTVGGAVIWNGEMRAISSLEDGSGNEDTVNVTPAFSGTPQSSDVLYATRMYRKSLDSDELGVLIEWEIGGIRTTMTGCKGNVALTAGEPPTLNWNLQVDMYWEEREAAPYNAAAAYTTADPAQEQDRIAWVGSSKASIGGFTASLNAEVQAKDVQGSLGINGRAGYQFTQLSKAGGSFRQLEDSSDADTPVLNRWRKRTDMDVLVVMGTHGRSVGVRMPKAHLIERPVPNNYNNMMARMNVMKADDAGTATDGAGTIQKVPDFALFMA